MEQIKKLIERFNALVDDPSSDIIYLVSDEKAVEFYYLFCDHASELKEHKHAFRFFIAHESIVGVFDNIDEAQSFCKELNVARYNKNEAYELKGFE